MLAGQRHESNGGYLPRDDLVLLVPFNEQQLLRHPSTSDRDHHQTAGLQLANQWWRYVIGSRGNDNRIKGPGVLPAEVTIAEPCRYVVIAEPPEACGRGAV